MPRKLKTFTTSAGFFDLAIAAPSMKAALAAWGSNSNLFNQGFAEQSDDPKIVAATMAKPGVVLRRQVGTTTPFSEHTELSKELALGKTRGAPAKPLPKPGKPPTRTANNGTEREAALAFEREQKRRERESRREDEAREKEHARRDRAIAAAEAALNEAVRDHQSTVAEIKDARRVLDEKLEAEKARWKKKRERLGSALRRARSPS